MLYQLSYFRILCIRLDLNQHSEQSSLWFIPWPELFITCHSTWLVYHCPTDTLCGSDRSWTYCVYPVGTVLQTVVTPPSSPHSHISTIYWNRTNLLQVSAWWVMCPVDLLSTIELRCNSIQPDCSFHLCILQPSHMVISHVYASPLTYRPGLYDYSISPGLWSRRDSNSHHPA